MELRTKIVITPKYSSEYECNICVKKIEGMLYNVSMGQEMILLYEERMRWARVINIRDCIGEDIIYREIEIVLIDKDV